MNTDDLHDFLHPRRGPAPLTPSDLAEQLAADHPQLCIQPDVPLLGGMGAVYRATLTTSAGPRPVAIKVLHWHLMDDPAFTARFQREQALLSTLNHENIVKLHDTGHTAEGLPFLVMDWIEGRSLTEFTQPGSTTDRQFLLRIAADLCAATHYAHEIEYKDAQGVPHKGILHRDLKPQNIIVTAAGRAIVLDFGIARSLTPGHTFTRPGDAPGTHGYIAPEVLAGEKPDARADIYSLGIIIYQLLMKKLPDVFAARPSEHSLDPRFDDIVMKAAASEREKRYKTAGELKRALELIPTMNMNPANAPASAEKTTPNVTDDEYPTPDPASITIELGETSLVVNGLDFSLTTTIEDWIQVLGKYSVMHLSSDYECDYRYYWFEIGLCAEFTNQSFIALRIASKTLANDVAAYQRRVFKNAPATLKSFPGVLRINGISISENTTSQNLVDQMGRSKELWIWENDFRLDQSYGTEELIKGKVFSITAGHKLELKGAMMQGSAYLSGDENGAYFGTWELKFDFIFPSNLDPYDCSPTYLHCKPDNFSFNYRNSFFCLGASSSPLSVVHIRKRHPRRHSDFIKPTVLKSLANQEAGQPLLRLGINFESLPFLQLHERALVYVDSTGKPTIYPFETRPHLRCVSEFKLSNIFKNRCPRSWRINIASAEGTSKPAEFTISESPHFPALNFLGSRLPSVARYFPGDGAGFVKIENDESLDELRTSYWFNQFSELAYFCYWTERIQIDRAIKFPRHIGQLSVGESQSQLSLHPCRTCGRDVAKSARTCPHCGENLRSGQKPSGWRQKACSNCGEAMARFAQKCQQPDCGHPNTWLKVQSFAATLAVLGTGLWSFLHFQQHLMVGLALPLMATTAALGWRGTLFLLKSFYGH